MVAIGRITNDPNDMYIMEKYKEGFIKFIGRCVNMLKCYENGNGADKFQ